MGDEKLQCDASGNVTVMVSVEDTGIGIPRMHRIECSRLLCKRIVLPLEIMEERASASSIEKCL
ncbi:hypothetical protein Dimus_031571, partial [Dionaea muscipula]